LNAIISSRTEIKYRITGDMIAEAITLDAIDDSGSPQRTVKGPEDA